MTKEAKTTICDSPQGGTSLFNMDFASDRLSWVKGIYQTLETSCNECVDACNKYVNTAGEQIKKICEEVCEWENPYGAEEPFSHLDLKHDILADVSNESSVDFVKNYSRSNCDQKQPNVSIPEDSDLAASSNESLNQRNEPVYNQDREKPLSTEEDICCSDELEVNLKKTMWSFPLHADPTSSPHHGCIQEFVSRHDEESLTISDYVPSVEVNGISQDAVSNESRAQMHGIASDEGNEKPLLTGDTCCSDGLKENLMGFSDTSRFSIDPTSSVSQGSIQIIVSNCDEGSSASQGIPPDAMGSWQNADGQKYRSYKLVNPELFFKNDVAEVSDGMEDFTSSAVNMPTSNVPQEEFETVQVEDFDYDDRKDEIAFTSLCMDRNMSLKKKLRNVFLSRKRYDPASYHQYMSNNMRGQSKQTGFVSSVPSRDLCLNQSTQKSVESGWELL